MSGSRMQPLFNDGRVTVFLCLSAVLGFLTQSSHAQWITETHTLKAGWNAVWLPHDCSHADIQDVIPNTAVEQVWRWNPPISGLQFTVDPQTPVQGDSQWSVWERARPVGPFSTLFRLSGNAAYLIKVANSVGTGTITVSFKGKPLPPRYPWKESGVNLFGFSTPGAGAPSFESFFQESPALRSNPPVFAYLGGAGLEPIPTRVASLRNTPVARGSAYWIQSTGYTDYYGPVQIVATATSLNFGAEGQISSIRLKNVTASSMQVTIALVASENPPSTPSGLAPVAGAVPLKVRGQFNPITSQFAYDNVPLTISLTGGEEREIVFALNRSEMGATAGAEFQSLLRISDSLGFTQINLPVRAVTTSLAGLWIGEASISTVDQVVGNTLTPKPVSEPFPLRFLVHMDGTGKTTLLQQAYIGSNTAGSQVISTAQSALDQTKLSSASRLATASFPLDLRVPNGGPLGISGSIQFAVPLPAGASTNPFLHIYHPDHGPANSYSITRNVQLAFASSLPGVNDPSFGSTILGGTYSETITGLRAVAPPATGLSISGTFVLSRVSTLPDLITP